MIKKILKNRVVIIIVSGLALVSPVSVFAYDLLESLPGLSSTDVTLSDYLGWLFPFTLTIVAILAVIMIVIGGLELTGGGSEGLKTAGKKKIEGAIYGLLLAISAFLILYTINPNLVNMDLSIDSVTIKEGKVNEPMADSKFCYVVFTNTKGDTQITWQNKCVKVSDCNSVAKGFKDNENLLGFDCAVKK